VSIRLPNASAALLPALLGLATLACTLAPGASQSGPATSPTAAVAGTAPTPKASGGSTKVALGQVGGLSDAAFFIAAEKGYFREQGIELEVSRFASAAQMVAPLGAGQLDVGGGAPSAGLLNAMAREVPLKIVAD
jgi:NitT/TauT family transport system substrate-binding protein